MVPNGLLELFAKDLARLNLPQRGISHIEEKRLAARIKKGDLAARDALALSNIGIIFKGVSNYLAYGNNKSHFMDLLQEANLGALISAARHNPKLGRYRNYLIAWVRQRIWLAFGRKKHRALKFFPLKAVFDSQAEPSWLGTAKELEEKEERVHKLKMLLERMKPLEREMIKMRFGFLDGETHEFKEVAERFGKSLNACKSIIFGCLRRLRYLQPRLFN